MPDRVKGKTLIAGDEGDDASGVLIKLYSEETNGAVAIIEQPFEPGLLLPPHVHQNDVWLYILEGEMHARVGDEVVKATPGCWVMKPRLVPHTMWNAGPEPGAPDRGVHAGWIRALLQGLRRPAATGADWARRTESPRRAARHRVLRRLDRRAEGCLQPARHRRVAAQPVDAGLAQRLEFVVGQRDLGGRDVLLEMCHLRRAGDGQHHRRPLEQPGQRQL